MHLILLRNKTDMLNESTFSLKGAFSRQFWRYAWFYIDRYILWNSIAL